MQTSANAALKRFHALALELFLAGMLHAPVLISGRVATYIGPPSLPALFEQGATLSGWLVFPSGAVRPHNGSHPDNGHV
jgi:hypothetical protein